VTADARVLIKQKGLKMFTKENKVLFIVHDVYQEDNQFPLGAGYLAAVLNKNGAKVEAYCMDVFHYTNEQLAKHLQKNDYDLIGVGFMVKNLKEKGLFDALREEIKKGKPYLGICLGLHVLFEESEESPGVEGLGIFKGKVQRFKEGHVPHTGWNIIKLAKEENGLFKEGYYYFVHSYYVVPEDKEVICTITDYNVDFCSSVKKDNIIATQFHPERSGKEGIEFLRRWVSYN